MDGLAGKQILDVIGIGIGPFNLSIAALLEKTGLNSLFFDKKSGFQWHPGMLMEGTSLQVPFMADAVTMVDPTSSFSFLNYLHENNRLYQFYFYENFHIPRIEYNDYCQWVAGELPSLQFGTEVVDVSSLEEGNYSVTVVDENGKFETYETEHIVMGIGTEPYVPEKFCIEDRDGVVHSSAYMDSRNKALEGKSVAVIGSGQSAAEIFYDLLSRQPEHAYRLSWYTRSPGFYPMEYSKLGLEHFTPDYTKYFYQLPKWKKPDVLEKQSLLYKGISFETISDIYDLLYERSIGGCPDVHLQALTELVSIEEWNDGYRLLLHQHEQEKKTEQTADIVILATGYRQYVPGFLKGVEHLLEWDGAGRLDIQENYEAKAKTGRSRLFIQNGELHTHGVGAPDLGLGAFRSARIINQIADEEIYQIHEQNAFQKFGASKNTVTVES